MEVMKYENKGWTRQLPWLTLFLLEPYDQERLYDYQVYGECQPYHTFWVNMVDSFYFIFDLLGGALTTEFSHEVYLKGRPVVPESGPLES